MLLGKANITHTDSQIYRLLSKESLWKNPKIGSYEFSAQPQHVFIQQVCYNIFGNFG